MHHYLLSSQPCNNRSYPCNSNIYPLSSKFYHHNHNIRVLMYLNNDLHLTHFPHLHKFYSIRYHLNNHLMVPKISILCKPRHVRSNHTLPNPKTHLQLSILLHRPAICCSLGRCIHQSIKPSSMSLQTSPN